MVISGSVGKSLKKMLCLVAFGLFFCLILSPINVFAMNTDYLASGEYWADKGETVIISEGTLNGCLKYELDEVNGCAYFYFYFADTNANITEDDGIYLGFIIENELRKYEFTVCEKGVYCNAVDYIDCFDIAYNFFGLNSNNNGGELFVAFELKNRDDLKANNKIGCYYSINLAENTTLLKGDNLDMTAVAATKTTAKKLTTEAKSTTVKKTIEKTTKETTAKTAKQTTAAKSDLSDTTKNKGETTKPSAGSSTKFTPKSTSKKAEKSAKKANQSKETKKSKAQRHTTFASTKKFAPSQSIRQSTELSSHETSDERQNVLPQAKLSSERQTTALEKIQEPDKISSGISLSTDSKIVIALAVLAFVSGIVLILTALFKGKYKLVSVNKDEKEDKNKE